MTAPSLDEARAKVRWATKHFRSLKVEIECFQQSHDYRIRHEVNADQGRCMFYVHGLKPLNEDWPLLIGDCVHNARSALDYLAVQLVALKTGSDPSSINNVQFPIYDSRNRFCRATREMHTKLMYPDHLIRIEELQPFHADESSIWGTTPDWKVPPLLPRVLSRLAQLDNVDKHRTIHATWHGVDCTSASWPKAQPGLQAWSGGIRAQSLEEGALIGTWLLSPVPLSNEWEPDEIDVKQCFPLYVAFSDPAIVHGVIEVLEACIWGVEQTLTIFEPAFNRGAPALPVTSSLEPERQLFSEELRVLLE